MFSSTKSLAAIAMATLVDRGLISYDDKVSKIWPEFAANGKEDILVCDVLRHEAGLFDFEHMFSEEKLLRENIKKNAIGEVLEKEKPHFPPQEANTKRQYHALTRKGTTLKESDKTEVSNLLRILIIVFTQVNV